MFPSSSPFVQLVLLQARHTRLSIFQKPRLSIEIILTARAEFLLLLRYFCRFERWRRCLWCTARKLCRLLVRCSHVSTTQQMARDALIFVRLTRLDQTARLSTAVIFVFIGPSLQKRFIHELQIKDVFDIFRSSSKRREEHVRVFKFQISAKYSLCRAQSIARYVRAEVSLRASRV